MNKTLKLAFGAVLATGLLVPMMAQDNFPDAPEYHWAFRALLNMKNEGILVGYPDGFFRGGRMASRYEMAVAINAAYERLKGMFMGLSSQIDMLNQKIDNMETDKFATKDELAALRDMVTKLQSDMAAMRGWGDDIANLKRMADMFQKDLAELGVDVETMKKDLSDINDRLTALEKIKPPVQITGDVNFVAHAGHGSDNNFGVTVDGKITGFNPNYANPVGMTRDFHPGHEAAFRFSGTNDTGPKWRATVVVGNLLGFDPVSGEAFYGDQSSWGLFGFGGPGYIADVNTNVYIQDFAVMLDTSLGGQGFTAEIGRIGYQTGNYFFKRPDNTPYFDNPRWDDGNWYFDGGRVGFDWGTVDLNVWAGKHDGRRATDGTEIWPNPGLGYWNFGGAGFLITDVSLGFNLGIDIGDRGDVMLNYIFLEDITGFVDPKYGNFFDRVEVYGGEVNFGLFDNFNINGGYSRSVWKDNTSNVLDEENYAWWAQLGYNSDRVNVNVGYRRIEPYFVAPGDWGRIAYLANPVDHQGFFGKVNFRVSNNVDINVGGYYYEGLRDVGSGGVWWDDGDKITGIMADVNFAVNPDWTVMLGFEHVNFDLTGLPNTPRTTWFRVGFNYNTDATSFLKFLYEFSDSKNDFWFGTDMRGGFLTIQWSKMINK